MTVHRPRTGFTLVELLVVTGLLATLFALLAVGGRPSEKGSVRRAAQEVVSAMLAAQTRAIGVPEGSGIVIQPDITDPRMATAVFEAVAQNIVTESLGAWPPSGFNNDFNNTRVTSGTISITDPTILANAYKARLHDPFNDPISPWFALTPLGSVTTAIISFRTTQTRAVQTIENTGWPPRTPAVRVAFAQYPSPGSLATAFNKLVAIDLKHSGLGDQPTASHGYGSLENIGALAVFFDEIGRVSEIMRRITPPRTFSDQPATVIEPLYLLISTRSDIQQNRSLGSQNSLWVVLSPLTGRATVSENIPQSGTDAASLQAARGNARAGIHLR